LKNKKAVKSLNEVGCVQLGGDGRGDCSALIARWLRGFQQEGQGELQKQLLIELKIKADYC